MMKENILPADTYIVLNKTILRDEDRTILTMLYQPIIGGIATNLYFTLWSNLDRSEFVSHVLTHHYLMGNMRLSIADILEAREKLEAIGLLKTYFKKDTVNSYIYELYSPLSAYDFLGNPILSTTLYNHIGSREFERLVQYFSAPKFQYKEYVDITSSFHEVFESTTDAPFDFSGAGIKKVTNIDLAFQTTIDFFNVLSLIPKGLLNEKTITPDRKELIYQLAFIYSLKDEEMADLLSNSIDEKRMIDVELLKQNCRKYSSFENSGKLPTLVYKNQPKALLHKTSDTTLKSRTIYMFEHTSPYDFLCSKNKGVRPSKNELMLIEHLMLDYQLSPGVVNVLCDYVLRINENKLTKNFVEAIASQWKKSNIKTVEEAMNFAEKEHRNRKNMHKEKTVMKKESKPKWFDQKIDSELLSDSELKELEEKISQV